MLKKVMKETYIDLLPLTDGNVDFTFNIAPEIKILKGSSRDICFHKVIEYLLPRSKGRTVMKWEW